MIRSPQATTNQTPSTDISLSRSPGDRLLDETPLPKIPGDSISLLQHQDIDYDLNVSMQFILQNPFGFDTNLKKKKIGEIKDANGRTTTVFRQTIFQSDQESFEEIRLEPKTDQFIRRSTKSCADCN